ncbi:zincin-like metallopeptidase domain-containing protein [Xanthomonas campestris pv. campestris]|nr:zincin-like metallopeptidase domain-containing protein [Xanthomonas campestris pv. campestris]
MASEYSRKVSEALIDQLRRGVAPWQRPWKEGERRLPYNPTSGNDYRGINSMYLASQGYDDARWLTYKQATALGAQVKRGEKGTVIEYWKFNAQEPVRDAAGNPVVVDGKVKTENVEYDKPRVFHAVVFNAAQIDGMPAAQARDLPSAQERHELAEQILRNSGARIRHGGDRAFYKPSTDSITLPTPESFDDSRSYYATALHELGHWTGHPDRLSRDLSHPFGTQGYAREELRAEIASLMVGDKIGLGHDPERHAAYVGSWIKALQEDPREIFRAAADAEKIQTYVLNYQQQQVQFVAQEQQVNLARLVELRADAAQAATDAEQAIAEARANPLHDAEDIAHIAAGATAWRDEAVATLNNALATASPDVRSDFAKLEQLELAVEETRARAADAAFERVVSSLSPERQVELGVSEKYGSLQAFSTLMTAADEHNEALGDLDVFLRANALPRSAPTLQAVSVAAELALTMHEPSSVLQAANDSLVRPHYEISKFENRIIEPMVERVDGSLGVAVKRYWEDPSLDGSELTMVHPNGDRVQLLDITFPAGGQGVVESATPEVLALFQAHGGYEDDDASRTSPEQMQVLEQAAVDSLQRSYALTQASDRGMALGEDGATTPSPAATWQVMRDAADVHGLQSSIRLAVGNENRGGVEAGGVFVVEYADTDGRVAPFTTHISATGQALTVYDGVRMTGDFYDGWSYDPSTNMDALTAAVSEHRLQLQLGPLAGERYAALQTSPVTLEQDGAAQEATTQLQALYLDHHRTRLVSTGESMPFWDEPQTQHGALLAAADTATTQQWATYIGLERTYANERAAADYSPNNSEAAAAASATKADLDAFKKLHALPDLSALERANSRLVAERDAVLLERGSTQEERDVTVVAAYVVELDRQQLLGRSWEQVLTEKMDSHEQLRAEHRADFDGPTVADLDRSRADLQLLREAVWIHAAKQATVAADELSADELQNSWKEYDAKHRPEGSGDAEQPSYQPAPESIAELRELNEFNATLQYQTVYRDKFGHTQQSLAESIAEREKVRGRTATGTDIQGFAEATILGSELQIARKAQMQRFGQASDGSIDHRAVLHGVLAPERAEAREALIERLQDLHHAALAPEHALSWGHDNQGATWATHAIAAVRKDDAVLAEWAVERYVAAEARALPQSTQGKDVLRVVQDYKAQYHGRKIDTEQPMNLGKQANSERITLAIPFSEKDLAKQLAKDAGFKLTWEKDMRAWSAPADADLTNLRQWVLGANAQTQNTVQSQAQSNVQDGNATRPSNDQVAATLDAKPAPDVAQERTYLAVPYDERETAKQAAADAGFRLTWDGQAKAWYAPAGADLAAVQQYLPTERQVPAARLVRPEEEFGDALRAVGMYLEGPAIMDGEVHRVRVDRDRGAERSGMYVGHLTGHAPGGHWENNRTKEQGNWSGAGIQDTISPQERAALNAAAAAQRQAQEAARVIKYDNGAETAQKLFAIADVATPENAYCAKKGITETAGLRTVPEPAKAVDGLLIGANYKQAEQLRADNPGKPVFTTGDLLIPLQDIHGKQWSVQSVNPSFKGLMSGGKKTGLHAIAGGPENLAASGLGQDASKPLIVAEGYATADAISKIVGHPVIVAFDSGNLLPVATGLREAFPDRTIYIAGDNDHKLEGTTINGKVQDNIGVVKAKEAAAAVGGLAIIPSFAKDDPGSDWNDVAMKPDISDAKLRASWDTAVTAAGMQTQQDQQKHASTQNQVQALQQAQVQKAVQPEQQKQKVPAVGATGDEPAKKRGVSR